MEVDWTPWQTENVQEHRSDLPELHQQQQRQQQEEEESLWASLAQCDVPLLLGRLGQRQQLEIPA